MTPEEKVKFDDWLSDDVHRLERKFINVNSDLFAEFVRQEYLKVIGIDEARK